MGEGINQTPEREQIGDVLKRYKQMREEGTLKNPEEIQGSHIKGNQTPQAPIEQNIPTPQVPQNEPRQETKAVPASEPPKFNRDNFEATMSRETDPDLMTSYEVVKLPSKGLFYRNGISEVLVEYMTSRDEDLLTTPSLIDSGTALDVLLDRKIKKSGISAGELLTGDRNAIILFLRSSSYGSEYTVQVPDPRTNVVFKTSVDLLKLKYKKVTEEPNGEGYFNINIPMRKKEVVFRLLTSGEESMLAKQAEALQEAYGQEYSEYNTLKLKSHIVSIGGNTDRSYISKFVDAMPALDALTIRRKIVDVSPDVDMSYEFTAKDGYKFTTELSVGIDFFFPSI